jgi:dienelactone hydrolase
MKHTTFIRPAILAAGLAFVMFASTASALPAPPDVWKDYDPDKGDYKEEIVLEEVRDGIRFRDTYISAYVLGEEVRVFCKYAVKAGAVKAPGLMDIHGWMSKPTIDMSYVKDGWAVMAHDYCGRVAKNDRPDFTRYPDKLSYGNMDAETGYRIKSKLPDGSDITDPKQTDDYLWYAIERRVLSYLLSQKEVDPARIGAKGYSYGGTIVWNLGMDPRVKAVVAYFGIGWLEYYRSRQVWMYNVPPKEPEMTPGERLYLSAIAPQAHAPYVRAASLWLNGTNDHHGGHERGEQTFKKLPPGVPWAFAHQARGHHNTEKLGDNCKLWLEKHVLGNDIAWPAHPKSGIVLDPQGVPEFRVQPADPERVTSVEMFYALKNPVSFARAWRDTPSVRSDDTWTASLPVLDVGDYVFAFANIRYDNNIVLSTDFNAVIPSQLGKAVATDKHATELTGEEGFWSDTAKVEGVSGVAGIRALDNRKGTSCDRFADPKWKAPRGAALGFRFYCTQPQKLLLEADGRYQTQLEITASDDWQSMKVAAMNLKNPQNGMALRDWSDVGEIRIRPQNGMDITMVIFSGFHWDATGDVPHRE